MRKAEGKTYIMTKSQMNQEYIFIPFTEDKSKEVIEIYNSNPDFLQHHLAVKEVQEDFIAEEQEEMKEAGFQTMLVSNRNGHIIGLCDFRVEKETYLSLLMLDSKAKGQGAGRAIYSMFEGYCRENGVQRIRIDVVSDYEGSPYGFWSKLGFRKVSPIEIEWGGNKLEAIVMKKEVAPVTN